MNKPHDEVTTRHKEETMRHYNKVTTRHNEETTPHNDKQPHKKVMAFHIKTFLLVFLFF